MASAGVFTNLSTVALNNNQLTGPLPESWGENANLPGLQSLDVSANNLSGSLPAVWGHNNSFTLLTNLNLANNTLSGGLPADWANAGRFPALQQLEVQYNQLSGVHAALPSVPMYRLCMLWVFYSAADVLADALRKNAPPGCMAA